MPTTTRREFMRDVGIMLLSLMASRCQATAPTAGPSPTSTNTPTVTPTITCYLPTTTPPSRPTPSPTPICDLPKNIGQGSDWQQLRNLWYSLDHLAHIKCSEDVLDQLTSEHRATLDRLVQSDILTSAVADEMQIAFDNAAFHVWRMRSRHATCYITIIYMMEGRENLVKQALSLTEMTQHIFIDEVTVMQIRAAIARDIALLSMTGKEQHALIEAIGSSQFEDMAGSLDIPPESTEAARILVELLLGRQE